MKLLSFLILLLAVTLLPGCLIAAGAAVGATAVAATSEDTVEVVVNRPMATVYEDSIREVSSRGDTQNESREFYRLEGKVGTSQLWVNLSPLDDDETLIRVRARRLENTLPNLKLARSVASAIAARG